MPLNNASIIQNPYRAKKCWENASTMAKSQGQDEFKNRLRFYVRLIPRGLELILESGS
jgi:hypothetical protein